MIPSANHNPKRKRGLDEFLAYASGYDRNSIFFLD
jgi:hypothetical protein